VAGGGGGGQNLGAGEPQPARIRQPLEQVSVAGQPVGGGQQLAGPQAQREGLLEQVGALQQDQALLASASGPVQAPQGLDEGIADAADRLAARCEAVLVRGGARDGQMVLRRRSLRCS
jgi:hypothetical protein